MADSNRIYCSCPHCRLRSLMGPLVIITVGVLFLIAQFSRYSFGDLWPVLLIVIGALLVAQHLASKQGHISS
jgi:cell wall-active antibiotic response 4TMS protein YvqF